MKTILRIKYNGNYFYVYATTCSLKKNSIPIDTKLKKQINSDEITYGLYKIENGKLTYQILGYVPSLDISTDHIWLFHNYRKDNFTNQNILELIKADFSIEEIVVKLDK